MAYWWKFSDSFLRPQGDVFQSQEHVLNIEQLVQIAIRCTGRRLLPMK